MRATKENVLLPGSVLTCPETNFKSDNRANHSRTKRHHHHPINHQNTKRTTTSYTHPTMPNHRHQPSRPFSSSSSSSILPILLSLLLLFTTLTSAADPTSFCKCTCGSQSTIIPLSDPKAATCLDCNRQFCLNYNLPICKDTKEEDVFTTCFQRDSVKDQTVVVIFIIATGGLLVYAAVRPWVGRWLERREAAAYDPLPH